MTQPIIVNGEEYVKEEVDGKEYLVKKADQQTYNLTLTRAEAEALLSILAVVVPENNYDLNYSGVVWFADFMMTFSDEVRVMQSVLETLGDNMEDGSNFQFVDKYIKVALQ